MLKHLKKHWLWLVLSPLFLLGEIVMTLWQPRMMTQIVDEGVLMGNMELVVTVGGRMLLLVLFGGICGIPSRVDLRKQIMVSASIKSRQKSAAQAPGEGHPAVRAGQRKRPRTPKGH